MEFHEPLNLKALWERQTERREDAEFDKTVEDDLKVVLVLPSARGDELVECLSASADFGEAIDGLVVVAPEEKVKQEAFDEKSVELPFCPDWLECENGNSCDASCDSIMWVDDPEHGGISGAATAYAEGGWRAYDELDADVAIFVDDDARPKDKPAPNPFRFIARYLAWDRKAGCAAAIGSYTSFYSHMQRPFEISSVGVLYGITSDCWYNTGGIDPLCVRHVDAEFQKRALKSGYHTVVLPQADVTHTRTHGLEDENEEELHRRSCIYMMNKLGREFVNVTKDTKVMTKRRFESFGLLESGPYVPDIRRGSPYKTYKEFVRSEIPDFEYDGEKFVKLEDDHGWDMTEYKGHIDGDWDGE